MKSLRSVVMTALFAVFLAWPVTALIQPFSAADISGNSTTKQVWSNIGSPQPNFARWILFVTCASGTTGCTGNSAVVRVGGSNTSVGIGAPIAPGGGLFMPPIPVDFQQPVPTNNYYDLTAFYIYAQTGDKVSVIWGN
jgi:hypothetical protein